MIDSLANLLFRCSHRRLTRPVTPVSKSGAPDGRTYVVCLDCGKQFPYDLVEMRVGRAEKPKEDTGVLHAPVVKARTSKWKYAAAVSAVPLVWIVGKALLKQPPGEAESGQPTKKRPS